MRPGRATSLFRLIPLFAAATLCLPVDKNQLPQPQDLAARATYSVVPIDGDTDPGGPGNSGGSGGSGSGSGSGRGNTPTKTVTVTVVETLPPTPSIRTIYVTVPPATERITDTVVVTRTIEIVKVGPGSWMNLTASYSGTSTTAAASSSASASTSTIFPQPSLVASASATIAVSMNSTTTVLESITPSTSVADPLQTGPSGGKNITTHDNGKWHTSYPPWNGTLLRRGSRNRPPPRLAV